MTSKSSSKNNISNCIGSALAVHWPGIGKGSANPRPFTWAICLDNLGTSALYGMVPGLLGGWIWYKSTNESWSKNPPIKAHQKTTYQTALAVHWQWNGLVRIGNALLSWIRPPSGPDCPGLARDWPWLEIKIGSSGLVRNGTRLTRGDGLAPDWHRIGRLAPDWPIGTGLADWHRIGKGSANPRPFTRTICLDNLGTSALYGMVPGLLGGWI